MSKTSIQVKKVGQLLGHKAAIYALDQGLKAHEFYSAGGEGWLIRWDLTALENGLLVARAESNIFSLKFLPITQQLLCGNMNGGLHFIDPLDKAKNKNIAHHRKGVFGIKKINENIITIGGSGVISKWRIPEMNVKESLHISSASLRCIAINKTNSIAAIGSSDQNIYFVDIQDFKLLHTIEKAHDNSVFSLSFNKDESLLISGGRDAHLRIWNLPPLTPNSTQWDQVEPIKSIPAHWFTINDITFHPEKDIFATASRDKTIKIWDANHFELLKVIDFEKFQGHVNSVNQLLWSKHNNHLISCSDDRRLIVWDINIQ